MPVPKRKVSKSRRGMRSSTKFLQPKAVTLCTNCSEAVAPHTVCQNCGFYKNRKVMKGKLDKQSKREEKQQQARKDAMEMQQRMENMPKPEEDTSK